MPVHTGRLHIPPYTQKTIGIFPQKCEKNQKLRLTVLLYMLFVHLQGFFIKISDLFPLFHNLSDFTYFCFLFIL